MQSQAREARIAPPGNEGLTMDGPEEPSFHHAVMAILWFFSGNDRMRLPVALK